MKILFGSAFMWLVSFIAATFLSQQLVGSEVCTLCEDGSRLRDPSRVIALGATCQGLNIAAIADSPENCVVWRATAGEYCGCHNPIASEGFCRVCGGTTPLPNPGLIARDTENMILLTCGQIEFDSYKQNNCEELQARFASQCCDFYNPSTTPTVSNTSGAVGGSAGAFAALVSSVVAALAVLLLL